MAPAGDQTQDEQRKQETFFFSNMAPQLQQHNSPTWSGLEGPVRSWIDSGRVSGEYVITGGAFYDPAEEDQPTAEEQVEHDVIGDHNVGVPTFFFKVVLGQTSAGEWKRIGFFVPHKKGLGTIGDWCLLGRCRSWSCSWHSTHQGRRRARTSPLWSW